MIDMLVSGDLLLDTPAAVDRLVAKLVDCVGLPEPRPTWGHDFPHTNYKAMFARVHPKLAVAPTSVEVIAPRDQTVEDDTTAAAWRDQRDRPVRTHATVFASRTLDEVVAHVRAAGIRHRFFPPDDLLPFGRLWLGIPAGGADYEPDADGGLRIEVIPYEVLRIPDERVTDARPAGSFERVVARTFLVDDVAATLASVRAALGWDGGAVVGEGLHGPTAVLQPADDRSGALELVRPTRRGPLLDFYERFGAGPYGIRLGVHRLRTALSALDDRGTAYRVDGDVVTIDPAVLDGAVIELCGM